MAGGSIRYLALPAHGERVFFVADAIVDDQQELFEAPIDGRRSARRISAPITRSGFVFLPTPRPTPQGDRVLYLQDAQERNALDLFLAFEPPPSGAAGASRPTRMKSTPR